ncbi:hypothetical protein BDZ89DRAFT_1061896 [Hymenopellis radicata]|nr:hypothetical protein BDZ89DRAFT_1061896 [Hymenopellis radicata]
MARSSITNPNDLVQAFKTSGEFSRLREKSDGIAAFKARIEEIVKQRLISDQKLKYLPQDTVQRELMQEVERFPVIERAVGDMHSFSDGSLLASIQASANRVLLEDKGLKPPESSNTSPVHPQSAAPSSLRPTPVGTPLASGSGQQPLPDAPPVKASEPAPHASPAPQPTDPPSSTVPEGKSADVDEDEKMDTGPDPIGEEKPAQDHVAASLSASSELAGKERDLEPDAS